MTKVSHLSLQQRRDLLQNYLAKGRIASVSWTKKNGEIAQRTIQLWRESGLAYGKEFLQPNPAAHKPELFTCYELGNDSSTKWCNVSLDRLISVKMGGQEYQF